MALLTLFCLILHVSAIRHSRQPRIRDPELLPGWMGEVPQNDREAVMTSPASPSARLWVQSISWKPRAMVIHNLITAEEAQHIVDLSWPRMKRSEVVGPNNQSILDEYRTSYGTFVARHETEIVASIQERVAWLTRAPVVNQEDMQVLRYGIGQFYKRHTDSLEDDSPRMATLLIYLADPEEGGETSFPEEGSEWANPQKKALYDKDLSECAKGHVAFRPRRGDGLLFWSIHPDGKTEDPLSEHEGCPVIKGAKWTTTVWIHNVPFRPENQVVTDGKVTFRKDSEAFDDPGLCKDHDDNCNDWASSGECDKNVDFMRSKCGASCNICKPCAQVNTDCYD